MEQEVEITKYVVDFAAKQTAVEVLHTTTGVFGSDRRKDTVIIQRVEAWTVEALQAAVIESATTIRAEKIAAVAAEVVAESTKFSVPLELVK